MNDMMLLVEPLIPALRRYARALLRNRDLADDLVQDCLERVISRWHQRREEDDARKWVFAILHNLAMDRLRQHKTRGVHVPLHDVDESSLAVRATQEDGLHYGEVLRALDQLPEEQRSVLLLVSVEEMSYADVARVLGIPTGTVTSRLSRAREKLARLIKEGVRAVDVRPALRRVK
jgi:RNA polymerase sigma-70 factor (ECF subfamily)